ncbi:MAG: hypothetical protein GX868_15980 [Actinobacteria bacterium]|nr:hypothetical protein [Actinomycetota bacterium]
MFRCKPLAAAIFGLWTMLIWGQRLINIANDDLQGFELAWSTGRALAFVVVGAAVLIVVVKPVAPATMVRVVSVAAAVTIALWSVQVVLIALRDYSVGFIVVHAVLGVVSIGLAVWATRQAKRHDDAGTRRSGGATVAAGL